jgi:predicted DNA-binding transcriptional regulator YafY
VGYVLRPGFTLPPLMFSEDEIEALVLGSRWVVQRADPALADAARKALDKISHVLPPHLRHDLENTALMVAPRAASPRASTLFESPELPIDPAPLRQRIRHFRLDRISLLLVLPDQYPRKRQALLKEWKTQQGLSLT